MKKILIPFLGISFFILSPLCSQDVTGWEILADTEFSEKYFEAENASFLAPNFGELTKAYEGKSFEISGFVIPLDAGNNEYILSKYPYASCFFCGGAGPESVIELSFPETDQKGKNYQIDEYLTFKGILILNESDIFRMNFILNEAIEIDG